VKSSIKVKESNSTYSGPEGTFYMEGINEIFTLTNRRLKAVPMDYHNGVVSKIVTFYIYDYEDSEGVQANVRYNIHPKLDIRIGDVP
jgi:hypothetical protein